MSVYILLCVVSLGVSALFENLITSRYQRKRYLIFCGLLMIIVIGFRSRYVGSTDTNNYFRMMERAIATQSWGEFYNPFGVEKGFQLWVFLLSRVFRSPQWILIISATIIVVSFLAFINDNCLDLPTSILMFQTLGLMIFEMQAMRQALAMSVCLWAYRYAKEQKLMKFLLIIAFATIFHRTSVAFCVVYAFRWLKMKPLHLFLFLVGAVVFIAGSSFFIGIANAMFNEGYDTAVNSGGFVAVAVYVLIILVAVLYDSELKYNDDHAMGFYFLLFGCTCYVIRYVGALAAERISFYFMFGQNIVLGNAIATITSKSNRTIIKLAVYVLSILLFAFRLSTSNMIPYSFCF